MVTKGSSADHLTDYCDVLYCLLDHNAVTLNPKHRSVYTVPNVLSKEICSEIIRRGEEYSQEKGGWTTSRHKAYPTTDIPLECLFGSFSAIYGTLSAGLLPQMASHFGLNEDHLRIGKFHHFPSFST